ncbi:zinc finger C-x8-C-x5-C-x3-H type family protein [Striga asiatica]|uniref:Zinc finger C-x8-C-x5-C-x3-H type family protein n=1 Tax=Striga asiatica TaxID=4170 RepID=A0A5A7P4U6_STRAF|nr:zinc finger C-x8-C-x5-C-x3-H type family protein [Striga asiatica]
MEWDCNEAELGQDGWACGEAELGPGKGDNFWPNMPSLCSEMVSIPIRLRAINIRLPPRAAPPPSGVYRQVPCRQCMPENRPPPYSWPHLLLSPASRPIAPRCRFDRKTHATRTFDHPAKSRRDRRSSSPLTLAAAACAAVRSEHDANVFKIVDWSLKPRLTPPPTQTGYLKPTQTDKGAATSKKLTNPIPRKEIIGEKPSPASALATAAGHRLELATSMSPTSRRIATNPAMANQVRGEAPRQRRTEDPQGNSIAGARVGRKGRLRSTRGGKTQKEK